MDHIWISVQVEPDGELTINDVPSENPEAFVAEIKRVAGKSRKWLSETAK